MLLRREGLRCDAVRSRARQPQSPISRMIASPSVLGLASKSIDARPEGSWERGARSKQGLTVF